MPLFGPSVGLKLSVSGQLLHSTEPRLGAQVPLEHSVQLVAPPRAAVLMGHNVQLVLAAAVYWPASHASHEPDSDTLNLPPGQSVHTVA